MPLPHLYWLQLDPGPENSIFDPFFPVSFVRTGIERTGPVAVRRVGKHDVPDFAQVCKPR